MSTVVDFDPAARAASIKAAAARRATIAEDTDRLMRHAAREGWGEVEGVPTLSGDVLVFTFTSGRRGIIHLPFDSNHRDKEI